MTLVPDEPQLAPRAGEAPAAPVVPLVPMTVGVPAELRKELRIACVTDGVTVQAAVAEALRAWLDRRATAGTPSGE